MLKPSAEKATPGEGMMTRLRVEDFGNLEDGYALGAPLDIYLYIYIDSIYIYICVQSKGIMGVLSKDALLFEKVPYT